MGFDGGKHEVGHADTVAFNLPEGGGHVHRRQGERQLLGGHTQVGGQSAQHEDLGDEK